VEDDVELELEPIYCVGGTFLLQGRGPLHDATATGKNSKSKRPLMARSGSMLASKALPEISR
jgi:hypothetical protein